MNKNLFSTALFALLLIASSCTQPKGNAAIADGEWIQLFNGEDLSGWTVKIRGHELGKNFGNTFRVENGILQVRYDEYDVPFRNRFGHLFYKDEFSHYILRVEYRFLGEQLEGAPGWAYRNSGLMLHGQKPETMDIDQDFPTSIEVQLLGSDDHVTRTNLNVCTPGTDIVFNGELYRAHCLNSTSDYFWGDEWYTVEVEVRGNEVIRHIHNGVVVLEYTHPQLDDRDPTFAKLFELNGNDIMLHKGTISLQSEGHPIDFRKVELKVLEP